MTQAIDPEVARTQRTQHHGPLDRILELAHVDVWLAARIGRVSQLLNRGLGSVDRVQVSREISEARWLAGVWYARLAHHDMPQLVPLTDALIVGRTSEAKQIYVEVRPLLVAAGVPVDAPRWQEILSNYKISGLDVGDAPGSQFWNIVDLAMVDYRLKSPKSRATRRWQRSHAGATSTVLCAFCKATLMVLENGDGRDQTVRTNPPHVDLWAVAPHERREAAFESGSHRVSSDVCSMRPQQQPREKESQ